MTDLERRALLGDRQAQEECTRRGIVLPCPFCGGSAMIEYDDIMPFEYSVFCGECGVMPSTSEDKQVAIRAWNTRTAPPIGRCGECEHWADWGACGRPDNGWDAPPMKVDDFCSYFEPKGDEENAAD